MISLAGFKVVYSDKVLNAIALMNISLPEDMEYPPKNSINKPKFLEITAINEDGNIVMIHDEAWRFQFIPIIGGNR